MIKEPDLSKSFTIYFAVDRKSWTCIVMAGSFDTLAEAEAIIRKRAKSNKWALNHYCVKEKVVTTTEVEYYFEEIHETRLVKKENV